MSRESVRIAAFVMAIIMLMSFSCFGASAVIVSPAANSIATSGSLLISVKLTEPATVRITLYEEKEAEVSTRAAVNASGAATVKTVTEYKPVDTASMTSADLEILTSVYGGTATKGAVLSDGREAVKYTSHVYTDAAIYTGTGDVSFYTKQLSGLEPGLYRLCVETLGEGGAALDAQSSLLAIQEKTEEKTDIFQSQQSGALKFLQNMLKNLFK